MSCPGASVGGKRRSRKGGDQEDEDRCVRDGGEWMEGRCIGTKRGGRHRKGHKKSRKMRGGVVVGAVGPLSVGAMEWGPADTSSSADPVTGAVRPDVYDPSRGANASMLGGRRRKTRKGKSKKAGKRKSRTSRRTRKMKGGGWNPGAVNAAGAGYGFSGTTSGVTGGIAPAAGYQSRVGGIPMGGDGVRSA
jgi:hypothetical protein